jgi:hypothetical protein
MWSSRDAFENDFCPVKDDLLGAMYRASEHGLPQLVASVAPDVRAMLALSIAASCTERDLIALGGRVGSTLFALSRETRQVPSSNGQRKGITLSTKPLSAFKPLDDEIDDEDIALVTA